jgi:tRNA threonylcarbamoyladenosine biosynthesis protein TsaE
MTLRLTTAAETIEFGEKIGEHLSPGQVINLQGPLGSGKTTLVKGIAKALDIGEAVTSPSFTLISEYDGRLPLYHMDLYRIDNLEEFELLGAEELMYDRGVTVIEWGEKAGELMPGDAVFIRFDVLDDGSREITAAGIRL